MTFKYKKVLDYIYNYINTHKMDSTNKIPSERKLSKELNVSRSTIKYALDQLIEKRILYKVHGKGTFIRNDLPSSKLLIAKDAPDAFNLNVRSSGNKPNSYVISFKVLYNYHKLSGIFPVEINEFYELIRVRAINDTKISVEKSYFPFRYFLDANRYDFSTASLYEYMSLKSRKPAYFQKIIEVVKNNKYATYLDLSNKLPIFYERYITKDENKTVIEYTECYSNPLYVDFKFNS